MQRLTEITSNPVQIYRTLDCQSTGVSIKGSKGYLSSIYMSNVANAARFVKLYNKATAPTVGTNTPVLTLCLQAGSVVTCTFPGTVPFSLGIGIGCTTGAADNSTAAPTANDVIVDLFYQ